MPLSRWIDTEGRLPLFVAAGSLAIVFSFLGVFALFGVRGGEVREVAATLPDAGAGVELGESLPELEEPDEPDEPDEPASPAPPAEPARPSEWKVKENDTLYGVCREVYGSGRHWRSLAEANGLGTGGNAIQLRIGSTLALPDPEDLDAIAAGGGPATVDLAPPESARRYVVRSGDTWWSIAERRLGTGSDWEKLARANPAVDASRPLRIGQRLVIPSDR